MKELMDKIQSDRYYGPLYQKIGFDIHTCGFFDDGLSEAIDLIDSLKFICTPINHISKPTTSKHCVILTTGAMDPVHSGHLDMMMVARRALIVEGYEVLGGYISPSHDSYVSEKNTRSNSIEVRNSLISDITKNVSWLALDPWSGTFTPCDLNFTTIMERTRLYLKRYADIDTEIIYVCGGDRWTFAKTFQLEGHCVVVTRPGYEITEQLANTYIVEGSNTLSSTILRKMRYDTLPPSISTIKRLVLRDDGTRLVTSYRNYFSSVELVRVEDQRKKFNSLDLSQVISIDSQISGKFNLQTSRVFDMFGHTKIARTYDNYNLPVPDDSEEYALYDDDIHTGSTMNEVSEYLEFHHRIHIVNHITFNQSIDNTEILDNRDFIVFGRGGLVVRVLGKNYRVPYIYPFVDPSARCSVTDPMSFSIDIWRENMKFYGDRLLGDTDQVDLYELLGFNRKDKLSDICHYFHRKLLNFSTE